MRAEEPRTRSAFIAAESNWRRAARAALAAAGVAVLVGSGGGGVGFCFDYSCADPLPPAPPVVMVSPHRLTLQVGQSATFTATVLQRGGTGTATLQWCRRPAGATGADGCIPIPGATGRTYTLASARLPDDGALIEVRASDSAGTAEDTARLAVTAVAPVVYADGEFAAGDWQARATFDPAGATLAWATSHPASGGNPGAYLALSYTLPAPGGRLRVFHSSAKAIYDPAHQGALYVIDFAIDCTRISWEGSGQTPRAWLAMVQGGRRYAVPEPAIEVTTTCIGFWQGVSTMRSVGAADFVLVDGPACAAGSACPDFSASGAPIQFGFESELDVRDSAVNVAAVQGFDNWRVAAWPR